MAMKAFRRKGNVTAEQLDSETEGLDGKTYPKGSWLVRDGAKLQIMSNEEFERDYEPKSAGRRGKKADAPAAGTSAAATTGTRRGGRS